MIYRKTEGNKVRVLIMKSDNIVLFIDIERESDYKDVTGKHLCIVSSSQPN